MRSFRVQFTGVCWKAPPFAALSVLAYLLLGLGQYTQIYATHFDVNAVEAKEPKGIKAAPARLSGKVFIRRVKQTAAQSPVCMPSSHPVIPIDGRALHVAADVGVVQRAPWGRPLPRGPPALI